LDQLSVIGKAVYGDAEWTKAKNDQAMAKYGMDGVMGSEGLLALFGESINGTEKDGQCTWSSSDEDFNAGIWKCFLAARGDSQAEKDALKAQIAEMARLAKDAESKYALLEAEKTELARLIKQYETDRRDAGLRALKLAIIRLTKGKQGELYAIWMMNTKDDILLRMKREYEVKLHRIEAEKAAQIELRQQAEAARVELHNELEESLAAAVRASARYQDRLEQRDEATRDAAMTQFKMMFKRMTKGEAGYVLTKLRSNFWEDNLSAGEAARRDLQMRLADMKRNAVTKSPMRRAIVSDKTTFSHQVPTVSDARRGGGCF